MFDLLSWRYPCSANRGVALLAIRYCSVSEALSQFSWTSVHYIYQQPPLTCLLSESPHGQHLLSRLTQIPTHIILFMAILTKTVTDIALRRIGGNGRHYTTLHNPPLQKDPGKNEVRRYTLHYTRQIWAESGHRMPRLDITEEYLVV